MFVPAWCSGECVSTLFISVHSPVCCCCTQCTLSKTPRLNRSVTSQPILPPPAPTSSLVFPSPPRLDKKIGVPGRASWFREGVGLTLTPAPPSSRAPNPPGSQIKTYAGRQPAAGSATLCRPRRPRPVSLLDGLPVAVSLALLPGLAAAAAAGFAAVASVPGAAGLAGLAAVLQRGAGVSPLQAVVIQELGLEHRQVLLATADFSSQQHDVSSVPCFLKLQILVSLAVLLQLTTFDLTVRREGAQLGQFGGESSESSFVGSNLLLLGQF